MINKCYAPNNILGVAYIKAISNMLNYKRIAIQRQSTAHHDQEIKHDNFASGSAIRHALLNKRKHLERCRTSRYKTFI